MASATPDVAAKVDMQDKVKVGPLVLENTMKRDYLIDIEKKMQKKWAEEKVFEVDPPALDELSSSTLSPTEIQAEHPKWMGTFPYPYMNGSLHLGHAFTISKIEFAAGYQRMLGKRALFPMGFHVTGMPIKSAADKLIREMEMFGAEFESFNPDEPQAVPAVKAVAPSSDAAKDPSKATKGKLNAKSTGLTYQFQIMESIGVPREEIKKFADPLHWLDYFPPIAKEDCNAFGARIDWRRSFLTTDQNPFYDSFVRWQMNILHEQGRIKFGKRNTIYSIKDGQPCMDHDRSSGEALGPQEYTGIKMEVVDWAEAAGAQVKTFAGLEGKKIFLVAATLRPETMYGQTNCFVGPDITYGLYESANNEVFVITNRAARNIAYQAIFAEEGVIKKLGEIKGRDIVGTKIKAPFGINPEVWVLPMDSVLPSKGTGVVTSVPSDSPDDYANYMDLRKKAEFYKIQPEWVAFDIIPVVQTPNHGDRIAEFLCKEMKIQSPKDIKQLAEAKEIAYKEGFFNGTLLQGDFKGETVQDGKQKVKDQLIAAGLGFKYAEPEGLIMSRSADECVVALVDQWYINYGEDEWRKTAERLLAQMNTYFPETRNGFEGVLAWLKQWACSRSYGLGSRIPWDQQFLVESLSDSTIYMSYYTVAHLLQAGDIYGRSEGPLGIKPEDMTDEIWSYVLGSGAFPSDSRLPESTYAELKRSFNYFYPMDVRSSGKDLIPNHLTFCIYIHASIFPEHHWPKSMRANGHLMLNGKKMAKSTGNSLTLKDATAKFGADACRLALADAGDGMEDANFEELTANSAIQRLYTQLQWCEEAIAKKDTYRTGPQDSFWDKAFAEELNDYSAKVKDAYERTWYKEALKYGFYELDNSRRAYLEATAEIGMHRDLVLGCVERMALLVAPIMPHFAEYLWTGLLQQPVSIQAAPLPETRETDASILAGLQYVRVTTKDIRDRQIALSKKAKGGKNKGPALADPTKPLKVRVYVATKFPKWQTDIVDVVAANLDSEGKFNDAGIKETMIAKGFVKNKKAMPYVVELKRRVGSVGAEKGLGLALPFPEMETIKTIESYLEKTLKLEGVEIVAADEALEQLSSGQANEGEAGFSKAAAEDAEPGTPTVVFWNA